MPFSKREIGSHFQPKWAVIRDIVTTRYPIAQVGVFPTRVQGTASGEIVAAFERLEATSCLDTVIQAMGAGAIGRSLAF